MKNIYFISQNQVKIFLESDKLGVLTLDNDIIYYKYIIENNLSKLQCILNSSLDLSTFKNEKDHGWDWNNKKFYNNFHEMTLNRTTTMFIDINECEKMVCKNHEKLGDGIFIIVKGKTYYLNNNDFGININELVCIYSLDGKSWDLRKFKLINDKISKYQKDNSIYTLSKWKDTLIDIDIEKTIMLEKRLQKIFKPNLEVFYQI